jgi:hypothetical protein
MLPLHYFYYHYDYDYETSNLMSAACAMRKSGGTESLRETRYCRERPPTPTCVRRQEWDEPPPLALKPAVRPQPSRFAAACRGGDTWELVPPPPPPPTL